MTPAALSHFRSRKVLTHADELAAAGRFGEALAVLDSAERQRRDVEIERRLRRFRHQAGLHLRDGTTPQHWPGETPDLFPGQSGIVETSREQLTAETLRAGVIRHGSLIVRGLLDTSAVAAVKEAIDAAFDARKSALSGHRHDGAWYDPFECEPDQEFPAIPREWIQSGGGVLAADSPRALAVLIERFKDAGIIDLVSEYLQEEPSLSVLKTTLRIVEPSTRADVGWHQDGAFLGEDIRSLNLWLAVSDCGRDAPSLDMVPGRLDHIVATGTEGAAFDWSVSTAVVENLCGPHGWVRPHFTAGDAIFFDHLNLHRTGVDDTMTLPRYAVESWFFGRGAYPMAQIPITLV